MKHYLMLKTHCKTSLKYLCKKSTNKLEECYSYLGSLKYWKKHLKKHGKDIITEILEVCNTKEELTEKGIYWSKKLNVVKSEEYANLVEERGDGGPTMLGRKITPIQKKRQKKALNSYWSSIPKERRKQRSDANRKGHEMYRYITPMGIFTNGFVAAKACNCSNVTVLNRCVKDVDKKITSKKYWRFGWKNKTWRELGWYSELLDNK